MTSIVLRPEANYTKVHLLHLLRSSWFVLVFVALALCIGCVAVVNATLMASYLLLSPAVELRQDGIQILRAAPALVAGPLSMLGLLAAWFLITNLWYRNLWYEMAEDELRVHQGILRRTVQKVAFRDITQVSIEQGAIQERYGIGSVVVHFASTRSPAIREIEMVGLKNPQAVCERMRALTAEPFLAEPTDRAAGNPEQGENGSVGVGALSR